VSLGVLSYGISLTTLEEVFLNLAAQEETKPEHKEESSANDQHHDNDHQTTHANARYGTTGSNGGGGTIKVQSRAAIDDGKSYGNVVPPKVHKEEDNHKLMVASNPNHDIEAARSRLRPSLTRQFKYVIIVHPFCWL
jgi:hypothetical protein